MAATCGFVTCPHPALTQPGCLSLMAHARFPPLRAWHVYVLCVVCVSAVWHDARLYRLGALLGGVRWSNPCQAAGGGTAAAAAAAAPVTGSQERDRSKLVCYALGPRMAAEPPALQQPAARNVAATTTDESLARALAPAARMGCCSAAVLYQGSFVRRSLL